MQDKLKVVILCSTLRGSAAFHLPYLVNSSRYDIVGVLRAVNAKSSVKKRWIKISNKIKRIGILGAINGLRMRKWYQLDDIVIPIDIQCKKRNIPFFEFDNINSPKLIVALQQLDSDVGISLGNSYISSKVFQTPKFGMVNIHHEQLPDYQNAQSVIWQLYNNSRTTGFTIHKINKRIDEGQIIYQKQVPIVFKNSLAETVYKTYVKLMKESAEGLEKVLSAFPNYIKNASTQSSGTKYTTPSFRQFLVIRRRFLDLRKSHNEISPN